MSINLFFQPPSAALRPVLNEWNPKVKIKPKDLRNTIQTIAIDSGWDSYFLDKYVGHASNTVRRKHYFCDNEERLIPLLRDNVVRHVEAEISSWNAPADTAILPSPRLVLRELRNLSKINIRPAGLEPEILCLEGGSNNFVSSI